jgi:hypothetical protein
MPLPFVRRSFLFQDKKEEKEEPPRSNKTKKKETTESKETSIKKNKVVTSVAFHRNIQTRDKGENVRTASDEPIGNTDKRWGKGSRIICYSV